MTITIDSCFWTHVLEAGEINSGMELNVKLNHKPTDRPTHTLTYNILIIIEPININGNELSLFKCWSSHLHVDWIQFGALQQHIVSREMGRWPVIMRTHYIHGSYVFLYILNSDKICVCVCACQGALVHFHHNLVFVQVFITSSLTNGNEQYCSSSF